MHKLRWSYNVYLCFHEYIISCLLIWLFNHSCIWGEISTWVQHTVLWIFCWILFGETTLKAFITIFIGAIILKQFYIILDCFWNQGMLDLSNLKNAFLFICFGKNWKQFWLLWLLSIAKIKHHDQINLEKVLLGLLFRGIKYVTIMTWKCGKGKACQLKNQTESLSFNCNQRVEIINWECGNVFWNLKAFPHTQWHNSLARSNLNPPKQCQQLGDAYSPLSAVRETKEQSPPTTGDQGFKYLSLWRAFLFKLKQWCLLKWLREFVSKVKAFLGNYLYMWISFQLKYL